MKNKKDLWYTAEYFVPATILAGILLLSDRISDREWRIAGWVVIAVMVVCGLSYLLRSPEKP